MCLHKYELISLCLNNIIIVIGIMHWFSLHEACDSKEVPDAYFAIDKGKINQFCEVVTQEPKVAM